MSSREEIILVTWKDEGDFGFINTFTQADEDYRRENPGKIGVPYDPNRIRQYGSREEAQALAREYGARFEES